jgi:hypothetical protein
MVTGGGVEIVVDVDCRETKVEASVAKQRSTVSEQEPKPNPRQ